MFLFGVNYNLYYFLLTKRYKEAFMDEEFRTYVIINVTFVALITLNIMGTYPHISDDGLKHFKIIPSKNNRAIGMINEIYLASLNPCIL